MGKRGRYSGFFHNKSGQVTIFIIIAVVIVAIGIAVYFLYPEISSTLGGEQDPNAFIQSCMEDEIISNVELVSSQGGSLEPEFYLEYNGLPVEYLCYTKDDKAPCIIQQPFLGQHIESEIKTGIEPAVKNCFNDMVSSFESRGYDVTMREGDVNIELLPQRIISTFNYTVTLSKTDTKRYESFVVVINNNLYELIGIARSIINLERSSGDADPRFYLSLYPDLKTERKVASNQTKIYTITDEKTEKGFSFATRSYTFPIWY